MLKGVPLARFTNMKRQPLIFGCILLFSTVVFSQASDAALRMVMEKDRSSRSMDGKLMSLAPADHFSRGKVYFENRHFPESREHFQRILDLHPEDDSMAGALFMTGRSY